MHHTRGGCPPDHWGHGLQVLLEKTAGVALVTKLQAILLMEGDFNYTNKWIFGHEAINKLYTLGYVPGNQYSQKESTAEDAEMDKRSTMDISHQLHHPLARMSADADKCYDRINHIIMSLLLLAIIGCIRNLSPCSTQSKQWNSSSKLHKGIQQPSWAVGAKIIHCRVFVKEMAPLRHAGWCSVLF